MKVFRFMSKSEFEILKSGSTLINTTNHREEKQNRTSSIGFCFLDLKEYTPEYAYHFLKGIDDRYKEPYQVCVIFETNRNNLKKGKGIYAKPINADYENLSLFDILNVILDRDEFVANEYSTTSYNKEDFKIIQYAKVDIFMNDNDWKWREYNENN